MADLQTASCDVCGVIKGLQNHWFRVWLAGDGRYAVVMITGWGFHPTVKHSHCCGEEHATKKAGELLGKLRQAAVGSTEPPAVISASTQEQSSAERVQPTKKDASE